MKYLASILLMTLCGCATSDKPPLPPTVTSLRSVAASAPLTVVVPPGPHITLNWKSEVPEWTQEMRLAIYGSENLTEWYFVTAVTELPTDIAMTKPHEFFRWRWTNTWDGGVSEWSGQ